MITPEQLAKSGSESGHGAALMCWAAMNISKYPELKWLTHIPNGGWRDPVTANKLKAEGVKAGVPDYFLAVRRKEFAGLFIELKRPKSAGKAEGKPTKEQKEWIAHLLSQGYGVYIAYGWQEAANTIKAYLEYR